MTNRRLSAASLVVLAALLLSGCKEKVKGTIERYRPQLEQKRDLLANAATSLPEPKDDTAFSGPLEPIEALESGGNTELMRSEDFTGQRVATRLEYPRLLARGLDWLDGRDLPYERLDQPGETVVPELEAMLARRYVVLTRINENRYPAPQAEGSVDAQAFVVDLRDGKVKRAVRVLTVVPAGSDQELLPRATHDDLLDALAEATGGKFDIKRLAPNRPKVELKKPTELAWVLPPDNDDAPPAVLDMHWTSAEAAAANTKRAVELMAAGQDPATVCKGAIVLARTSSFDAALVDDIRRVCMRDASLFWIRAALAKTKHPSPEACAQLKMRVGLAAGAEGHGPVADQVYAACK